MNKERGLLVPGSMKNDDASTPQLQKVMRKVLKKEINDPQQQYAVL